MNYKELSSDKYIWQMYKRQVAHSIKRGDCPPEYSFDEFFEWIKTETNYEELFYTYDISGRVKDLAPSVDRFDDYKGYSFSNIRLVTWRENRFKYYSDSIKGINTKKCSAVLKYDLNGNFIKEYKSITLAAKDVGIFATSIVSVCNKRRVKTAGGFKWTYKGESLSEEDFKYKTTKKKVLQLDLNGNFINEFESVKEAAEKTGGSRSCISSVCCGDKGRSTHKGYKWTYK